MDLKSTLDAWAMAITINMQGANPSLKAVELDDLKQVDEVLGGTDPAILWQFVSLEPSPRDPLWDFKFAIGVKTTNDKANYKLAELLSAVLGAFEVNQTFPFADYSGATVSANKGVLTIVRHETSPQQFDHQSGIRLTTVVAKVVRCA